MAPTAGWWGPRREDGLWCLEGVALSPSLNGQGGRLLVTQGYHQPGKSLSEFNFISMCAYDPVFLSEAAGP